MKKKIAMNPKVDAFLERQKQRGDAMAKLRTLALKQGLDEELKWGKPCYAHEGKNVALIQGFKDYCALLFPAGALMKDPKGRLVAMTENTQAARQLRFEDAAAVSRAEAEIARFLKEAVRVARSGEKVQFKQTTELDVPEELAAAFDEDPKLKKAFYALTPGRQRGYLLHFGGAKRSETRAARIAKAKPDILEGIGWNERGRMGAKDKPASSKKKTSSTTKVKLLSGGNPQIPKGDGDGPVQAYIAAMPGWKAEVGRALDDLVAEVVPDAKKAVRWNSPFYGVEGKGWFLSFHCFAKYIKLTFFCGAKLKPPPPEASKDANVRYLHVYEDEPFDEKQLAKWLKQASKLPGWIP